MAEKHFFFFELWSRDLREYSLHFASDLYKTICSLAGLLVFWEGIQFLKWRGYPAESLGILEKTHFAFMWASLVVTSGNFVLKQLVSLWPKKK